MPATRLLALPKRFTRKFKKSTFWNPVDTNVGKTPQHRSYQEEKYCKQIEVFRNIKHNNFTLVRFEGVVIL